MVLGIGKLAKGVTGGFSAVKGAVKGVADAAVANVGRVINKAKTLIQGRKSSEPHAEAGAVAPTNSLGSEEVAPTTPHIIRRAFVVTAAFLLVPLVQTPQLLLPVVLGLGLLKVYHKGKAEGKSPVRSRESMTDSEQDVAQVAADSDLLLAAQQNGCIQRVQEVEEASIHGITTSSQAATDSICPEDSHAAAVKADDPSAAEIGAEPCAPGSGMMAEGVARSDDGLRARGAAASSEQMLDSVSNTARAPERKSHGHAVDSSGEVMWCGGGRYSEEVLLENFTVLRVLAEQGGKGQGLWGETLDTGDVMPISAAGSYRGSDIGGTQHVGLPVTMTTVARNPPERVREQGDAIEQEGDNDGTRHVESMASSAGEGFAKGSEAVHGAAVSTMSEAPSPASKPSTPVTTDNSPGLNEEGRPNGEAAVSLHADLLPAFESNRVEPLVNQSPVILKTWDVWWTGSGN